MDQPVAVITGCNRGIGFEIASGLAERGFRVVGVARTLDRAEGAAHRLRGRVANAVVLPMAADLGSLAAVRGLASEIQSRVDRLDALVLNAATNPARRVVTEDGYEAQFQVNHLAGFLLQRLLDQNLRDTAGFAGASRVVVVASEAHRRGTIDFEDLMFERRRYSRLRAYESSKLANVLHARALATRLKDSGVTANAVHPGVVSTGLLGGLFGPLYPVRFLFRSARSGAAAPVHLATASQSPPPNGHYFKRFKAVPTSPAARDEAVQERLWTVSEALVGLSDPT